MSYAAIVLFCKYTGDVCIFNSITNLRDDIVSHAIATP